jgi:hypothetical protein
MKMSPLYPPTEPERGPCDPDVAEEPVEMPEEAPVYIPQEEPIPVYVPEKAGVV